MEVDGQRRPPTTLLLGKRPGTHCIHYKVGWAPGPVYTGAENLASPPPPGFVPRTVQPVASPYTAYATPAHGTC
jgi:hypothetical protein